MRREIDSLGTREVPSSAYYGIQTQRAIDNFPISGYRAHSQLVRAIGMIKKAAALANRELKLVDAKRAGCGRGNRRQVERTICGGCLSGRRWRIVSHER